MYWNGNDYDKMAKLVIDIYVDYNIRSFPVDEKEIFRKLGLKLIPYSVYYANAHRTLFLHLQRNQRRQPSFTMIKSNHAEGFDTTYFMRSNTL